MKLINMKVRGCEDCLFRDFSISHSRMPGYWFCDHSDFKGDDSQLCYDGEKIPATPHKNCPLPDVKEDECDEST